MNATEGAGIFSSLNVTVLDGLVLQTSDCTTVEHGQDNIWCHCYTQSYQRRMAGDRSSHPGFSQPWLPWETKRWRDEEMTFMLILICSQIYLSKILWNTLALLKEGMHLITRSQTLEVMAEHRQSPLHFSEPVLQFRTYVCFSHSFHTHYILPTLNIHTFSKPAWVKVIRLRQNGNWVLPLR